MSITAIMIDKREPEWIKKMDFGIPSATTMLDAGDLWATTDDGHMLLVERKTPEDFLSSLRDKRLLPQLVKLSDARHLQQIRGETVTNWPYLIITDGFIRVGEKVKTPDRGETGWAWNSIQGALLSIQEMGIHIIFCAGPEDYKNCIFRLGERNRNDQMDVLPARQPVLLSAKEAMLATLPGIGIERVVPLMSWGGRQVSHVLIGLTDLSIPCPVSGIGDVTRKKIRQFLDLSDGENLELISSEQIGCDVAGRINDQERK